jgi:hypothetical protein
LNLQQPTPKRFALTFDVAIGDPPGTVQPEHFQVKSQNDIRLGRISKLLQTSACVRTSHMGCRENLQEF